MTIVRHIDRGVGISEGAKATINIPVAPTLNESASEE
jgi:hypothetical protein